MFLAWLKVTPKRGELATWRDEQDMGSIDRYTGRDNDIHHQALQLSHIRISALLSDALESTVNIAASVMMFLSVRISENPPDKGHPYGHQKIENISSFIEGGRSSSPVS